LLGAHGVGVAGQRRRHTLSLTLAAGGIHPCLFAVLRMGGGHVPCLGQFTHTIPSLRRQQGAALRCVGVGVRLAALGVDAAQAVCERAPMLPPSTSTSTSSTSKSWPSATR
jgi:hypothetical protein